MKIRGQLARVNLSPSSLTGTNKKKEKKKDTLAVRNFVKYYGKWIPIKGMP